METKKLRKHIALPDILIVLLAAVFILAGTTGCAAGEAAASDTEIQAEPTAAAEPAEEGGGETAPAVIDLAHTEAAVAGVTYADGVFTVTAAGAYTVTGSFEGVLAVDADGPVELVLDGAALTGPSCLSLLSDDTVTITTAAGTVNTLSDGGDTTGSALYADGPVVLGGDGALTVSAAGNNGIRCRSGLTVTGGVLTVDAANDGVKVRGALTVEDGDITVTCGGDALTAEASRICDGVIDIAGGAITLTSGDRAIDAENTLTLSGGDVAITAGNDALRADVVEISDGVLTAETDGDGVQAVTSLTISGGSVDIIAGGGGGEAINHAGESFGWGAASATADEPNSKGLQCEGTVTITGGTVNLSTQNDGITAGTVCSITDGVVTVLATDDGIHADDLLSISGGTVTILDAYEGLEAYAVEIWDGDVSIRAVNDGINANGPEMMFARAGSTTTSVDSVTGSSLSYVRIAGGTLDLVVTGNSQNQGDGIDSNGAVYIDGGVSVISTFGTYMENGIDTGSGGPVITGGAVIAGGSSTMAEGWDSGSTQCAASISTGTQPGGTEVTITDMDGNVIWSAVLEDTFSSLLVSHPDMELGSSYIITYGTASTTVSFANSHVYSQSGGFGGPGGFGGFPGFR